MAEEQLIAIGEQLLLDGPAIDETVTAAMIIVENIASGSEFDAGLFPVNGDILKKNVAFTAAANRGTVLPDLYAFPSLRSLLDDEVCCRCLLVLLLCH